MDDKKLKNLDVLETQIPELDENRLESIWNINPMALVLRVLVPRGMLLGALTNGFLNGFVSDCSGITLSLDDIGFAIFFGNQVGPLVARYRVMVDSSALVQPHVTVSTY